MSALDRGKASSDPVLRLLRATAGFFAALFLALPIYVLVKYFSEDPPAWSWVLLAVWLVGATAVIWRFRTHRDTWIDVVFVGWSFLAAAMVAALIGLSWGVSA